jgi:folate-binding protein YgfZ
MAMTKIKGYQAALKGAAYFVQPQAGFLRLTDSGRVDFLQRQTTNDLHRLSADRVVPTVLTSPIGRIIDVFTVLEEGESLGVLSLPGRAAETAKFLRTRIFFTDKVRVADISADIVQIILVGARVNHILEELGIQTPAPENLIRWELAGSLVTVFGQETLVGTQYHFVAPETASKAITDALETGGAVSLDAESFEILRVETGQPGAQGELVDSYTPLEVGLGDFISDSKGCYTGQEVIARQITYDKVTKKLVGITLDSLAAVGAVLNADGKSAGILTTVTNSPRIGPIGLAVVRRQYAEIGTKFSVVGKDDTIINGEIVSLPFIQS